MRPVGLRCEYLEDPLGIDERRPLLTWRLESADRDQGQSAFEVQVASTREALERGEADAWSSGRVEGSEAFAVYGGPALVSRQRCWWRVRAADRQGRESAFSEAAAWEMGLLAPEDWVAEWVQDPARAAAGSSRPSYFTATFEVRGQVRQARAYASAQGLYGLRLNGQRVSDDVLRPGWTDYHVRTPYQAYDVEAHLVEGENRLQAVLAGGWYSGAVGWTRGGVYGRLPALIAQLEIEYADGRRQTVATGPDNGWTSADGPIVAADLQMGEMQDLRQREPDTWRNVEIAPVLTTLVAARNQPVRRTLELRPQASHRTASGATVFDLGQNMVGWVRLTVSGEAGTTVTVRHAEALDDTGELYVANLRGAKATDTYVLGTHGQATLEPSFTFHGFRYVEVAGAPVEAVTGVVVHSDLPPAGEFECSDELVNRLQRNIVWGQRGNHLEIPTDCPQRDERLGWMGDAQVFARTACFNMDMAAFYGKWMQDVADARAPDGSVPDVVPVLHADPRHAIRPGAAPGWGEAAIVVPWTVHLWYGDTRILERHYDLMAGWVDHVHRHNPDLVWRARRGNDYGDWLSPGEATPKELIATAFFARAAWLVADVARRLGRHDEARRHGHLFEGVRAAFQRAYIQPDGRLFGDTQTAYVLAIAFGLLPDELVTPAATRLVAKIEAAGGHLATGFLGVEHLLPVLTETGHVDLAYRLLLNRTFPSWGFTVEQGATTIWERWDGWTPERGFHDPEMNSFNHYAFGAVGRWIYATVGGIDVDPDRPGFRHVLIRPRPGGGLTWARARHRSIAGPVATHWRRDGDTLTLDVEIPANSGATVWVPATPGHHITESGRPLAEAPGVHDVRRTDDAAIVEIGSGTYHFRAAG